MLRHTLPPHGKIAHRPAKKQAVHPTKKVSIGRIINRNASESPLLKLIPEIREMIWEAAIGDRTIHIKHFSAEQLKSLQRHQTYPEATEPNGAFRHIECTATTTEEEAYIASKTQSTKVPAGEDPACYVQSCKSRHHNCYQLENGDHGTKAWVSLFEQGDYLIDEKDRVTMCTMLGTCRQVYEEAYRIFWRSNAFSFDDPYSLREFLGSLTVSQKHHLRSLHVCERLDRIPGYYGCEWKSTLQAPSDKHFLDQLRGLRTFNLCLEQRLHTEIAFNLHLSQPDWLSRLSQPWLALRPAPLATVTVIISDKQSLMLERGLMHLRCTVQRKSEIAEEIRNNIMDDRKVAEARQDILDKNTSKKKRREELKQMKVRQEVQGYRHLPEAYNSMSDDLPKDIGAPYLPEMPFEQRPSGLPSAHTPYTGSLGFLQAAKYSDAHEQPQESQEKNMVPSFIHSHGDAVVPQAPTAQASRPQHHILYRKQDADWRNDVEEQTLEGNVNPQHYGPLTRPPMITYQQPRQLQGSTATDARDSHQANYDYHLQQDSVSDYLTRGLKILHRHLQQDSVSDYFYPRPQNRTSTTNLMSGALVQDTDPTRQTAHDPGNSRYHPYARPARVMDAHPAAHMPGAVTTGPQAYAGNSHFAGHLLGYATSAVSVPYVAYAGTNERRLDPGDLHLEEVRPSQIDASLGNIEVPDNMIDPRLLMEPENSV